jgi:hypothetical protein
MPELIQPYSKMIHSSAINLMIQCWQVGSQPEEIGRSSKYRAGCPDLPDHVFQTVLAAEVAQTYLRTRLILPEKHSRLQLRLQPPASDGHTYYDSSKHPPAPPPGSHRYPHSKPYSTARSGVIVRSSVGETNRQ